MDINWEKRSNCRKAEEFCFQEKKIKLCLTRIFSICVNLVCRVLDLDQARNKVSEEVEVKLAKENEILTHEYFVIFG